MKIGLALGGGGVRGLAHIPMLEAFDEYGLKPAIIAGTSMGAIVGALYASGVSGNEIRDRISRHLILKEDRLRDIIAKRDHLLKWVAAFSADLSHGGFIKTQGFLEYLFSEIKTQTFEELEIPLRVVAADYWTAEEIVFQAGSLIPALKASMAVPGVFAPASIEGRVLVDGGVVNLVPYDHVLDQADFTIAVDVGKVRSRGNREIPGPLESVLGAFSIMQSYALAEKMKHRKPDLYIQPDIKDVRMLDFGKADDVFRQTAPAVELLKKELKKLALLK